MWTAAPLLCGAWVVYALLFAAFGLLPSGVGTTIALFVGYAIFIAATEGAEKALIAELAPQAQLGTAFGWFHLVSGVMLLPASALLDGSGATPDRQPPSWSAPQRRSLRRDCCCSEPGEPSADAGAPAADHETAIMQTSNSFLARCLFKLGYDAVSAISRLSSKQKSPIEMGL